MEIKEKKKKKKKKKKKIFFFFKNKNNLLSKKLSTKRIKYDIFIDINKNFSVIHDKIKNILIFNGNHPSKFIQQENIYKYINVSNIKKISNGNGHTLILTNDNKLFSFGDNENGQCGINGENFPIIHIPIEIKFACFTNTNKIKDIVCKFNTSYFLLENNDLYVFGEKKDNYIPQKFIIPYEIIEILPSDPSAKIVLLEKTGKINKVYIKNKSHNINLSLFDKNKIENIFFYLSKSFFLLEDNIIYEQLLDFNIIKHEIPIIIPMKIGEHIIKIFNNTYTNIYLTTKSVYIVGDIKNIFSEKKKKKYEIKFFRNKKIIDILASYSAALSVSKNGIVYGWGINKEEIGLLRKTKKDIIYNSPIILYSS